MYTITSSSFFVAYVHFLDLVSDVCVCDCTLLAPCVQPTLEHLFLSLLLEGGSRGAMISDCVCVIRSLPVVFQGVLTVSLCARYLDQKLILNKMISLLSVGKKVSNIYSVFTCVCVCVHLLSL